MAFTLPELPYGFDALEPVIDSQTMQIHHDKHHGTYVAKLNAAIEGLSLPSDLTTLISDLSVVPEAKRAAVRNNGGGHANHSMFWELLAPKGQGGAEPSGALAADIEQQFGSFADFKQQFSDAAVNRFGSGWAWLCVDPKGSLCVCSTPNQDNPLMKGFVDCPGRPILGLDVWEHAYYLKYQNRRPDYVAAFWDVVNWSKVQEHYEAAKA